ncbi:MAG: diguanylate cyclase, partial [Rubrivivax sp.]
LALGYGGQHEPGLACLQQALTLLPDDALAPRVELLRAHAIVYEQLGALQETLDWALRAEALARELGDPAQLASSRLSVAVALSRSGDTEAGLRGYLEVLGLYTALGNREGQLQSLNNLGIACKNLGRFDEAVRHLEQAIALAGELGLPALAAVAMSNLGEPLWKLGRLGEARAMLAQSTRQLHAAGYLPAEIHARVLHGQILAADGEPALAQAELEQAVALSQKSGGRNHLARAQLGLAELHKAAGRFEQALAHHEAYHAAERAQYNEESTRQLRVAQVRFDLERARHEAQLQRLEAERLALQSRTDALTGLANRRHLDEHLASAFLSARRHGRPLAVAMLDIDDFKRINDAFGHGTGDAVLRAVATHLQRHCRDVDLVARYGGEEFCIVFDEADAALAERACEAARDAVEQHPWSGLHPALRVTLSIGLADHPSLDSPEALLADADAQLYAAKRAGKNRVMRG